MIYFKPPVDTKLADKSMLEYFEDWLSSILKRVDSLKELVSLQSASFKDLRFKISLHRSSILQFNLIGKLAKGFFTNTVDSMM